MSGAAPDRVRNVLTQHLFRAACQGLMSGNIMTGNQNSLAFLSYCERPLNGKETLQGPSRPADLFFCSRSSHLQ